MLLYAVETFKNLLKRKSSSFLSTSFVNLFGLLLFTQVNVRLGLWTLKRHSHCVRRLTRCECHR